LEIIGINDPDNRVTVSWHQWTANDREQAFAGNTKQILYSTDVDYWVIYECRIYVDGEYAFSLFYWFNHAEQQRNLPGEIWMLMVLVVGIVILFTLVSMYYTEMRELDKKIKSKPKKTVPPGDTAVTPTPPFAGG